MNIIAKSKLWLGISAAFMIASVILLSVWGLRLGLDFTGGSLLEVRYLDERPAANAVKDVLAGTGVGSISVQPVGDESYLIRFQDVTEDQHRAVLQALDRAAGEASDENAQAGEYEHIEQLRFETVGPSIGEELKQKSVQATIVVLIIIVAYIAWAFRHVSKPVASWKYGVAALVALFHDVLVTLGVFALLGRFGGVEIDTAFVAAILTVLGYSVNDTIVVFDRIRENLPRSSEDFAGTVNTSLNQTLVRSFNTSFTTLLVLLAIFFFGGASIKYFVLALIVGIASGTYSSIFLASPLLVVWEKLGKK